MAVIPWVIQRFEKTGSPVTWMDGVRYLYAKRTEKAVAWADALVGIREHGPNTGADVLEITEFAGLGKKGGYAWCAMFVYFVLRKAGFAADKLPPKGKCAAVRNWVSWAEARGRLRDKPGRGRLFYWLNKNGTGHIGICLGPSVLGIFRTVEGNTDGDQGSREGDGSYKRTRTMAGLRKMHRFGFIDLEGL